MAATQRKFILSTPISHIRARASGIVALPAHIAPAPRRFFVLALLLLLLAQAGRLVFQPDIRDDLRHADALFIQGRYHEALQHYRRLEQRSDSLDVVLRLGMVQSVRGEYAPAEQALWQVVSAEEHGKRRTLALLYLGTSFAMRGKHEQALRTWGYLAACPPRARWCISEGMRSMLQGEHALQQGNNAAATAAYSAARETSLPAAWWPLLHYRMALLQAADDPAGALAAWRAEDGMHAAAAPLLTPLLPDFAAEAQHLRAILHTAAPDRAQLLGQFYLDQQLSTLARAQFAAIPADSPHALVAATQAAYARWQAGQHDDAVAQMEQVAAAHPNNLRIRALLTLTHLAQHEDEAAQQQVQVMRSLAPTHPETAVARAALALHQGDYISATLHYEQAIAGAADARKGAYALIAARFHHDTNYAMCDEGMRRAEMAIQHLPDNAEAWTILAANRYYCRDVAGAVVAARQALDHQAGAEAAYYLGVALADLHQPAAARRALIRAADMAPASVWRTRAEQRLTEL